MARVVRFMAALAAIGCLTASATNATSTHHRARAQGAPQSREALYQQCRQEAFRRFGWHNGTQVVLVHRLYDRADGFLRPQRRPLLTGRVVGGRCARRPSASREAPGSCTFFAAVG